MCVHRRFQRCVHDENALSSTGMIDLTRSGPALDFGRHERAELAGARLARLALSMCVARPIVMGPKRTLTRLVSYKARAGAAEPPGRMRECAQAIRPRFDHSSMQRVWCVLYVNAGNGKITVLLNDDPASTAMLSGCMGYNYRFPTRGFQKLAAPCSYEGQLMTVTVLQNRQQALGRE